MNVGHFKRCKFTYRFSLSSFSNEPPRKQTIEKWKHDKTRLRNKTTNFLINVPTLFAALDPAYPLYDGKGLNERLHVDDAQFVAVIHTSGKFISFEDSLGHADFYPNGGKFPQPLCMDTSLSKFSTKERVVEPREPEGSLGMLIFIIEIPQNILHHFKISLGVFFKESIYSVVKLRMTFIGEIVDRRLRVFYSR